MKNRRKKMGKRALSALLTVIMAVTLLIGIPASDMSKVEAASLSNPRRDSNGVVTYDCVYFGNYWQEDTNGDGKADKQDTKMPIKWRVLSVNGNDAFLIADKNLDMQNYNTLHTSVTWETCTMRSWLNGYDGSKNSYGTDYSENGESFISNAFTASEQNAILNTTLENADNSYYGTNGGNATTDKVFLLSEEDIANPAYGFSNYELKNGNGSSVGVIEDYSIYDYAKLRYNTGFAKGSDTASGYSWTSGIGTGRWWLRSPGNYSNYALYVYNSGYVSRLGYRVDYDDSAVCPALHLNLSSSNLWFYAGTVSSDGKSTEGENPPVGGGDDPSEGENNSGDISSNGSLTMDANITVTSGYTESVAVKIRAGSGEEVKELLHSIKYESADTSIATVDSSIFNLIEPITWETSYTTLVDITGYAPGTTDITVTASDGSVVTCKVTVIPEELEPDISYKAGILQSVDTGRMKVTISGTAYNVTDDFDMSGATAILNDRECKTVAVTLANGYVSEMASVEDIMQPSVRLELNPEQVIYSNGKYSQTDGTVTAVLSCGAEAPYNTLDFSGLDVPSVHYSNLQLETSTRLYFEKKLLGGKVTSKEESLDEAIRLGESCSYTYDIHVDSSNPPAVVSNFEYINVTVGTDRGTLTANGTMNTGNLDLQEKKAESNKSPSKSQTISTTQEELKNNGITFALNPNPLNLCFDNKEIDKMEQCLDTWLSTIMAVSSIVNDEDYEFMQNFKQKHGLTTDDIMEKVFNKMGINYSSMTNVRRYTATTTVIAKDRSGNILNVDFVVKFSNYSFNKQKPYGSFGQINYSFEDNNGILHKAYMGVGGTVTYGDLDGFIESVQNLTESNLKSFYKKFWGNDADKVVEMLTSENISKLLDKTVGSFSDNVFKLMEIPGKSWYKLHNACPNDVYVYDSDGNLCGEIVDNEVNTDYDNIFMYVDGDEKYFYLMGEDYNIEYIGTDKGTMDLKIEAYEGDTLIRTIQYKDIPLEKDMAYESAVFENPYLDKVVYSPVSESEEIISSVSDSWQDDLTAKVFVNGITLDNTSLDMEAGIQKMVNATVTPSNASYPMVTYKSDDEKVAVIDESGMITAVSEGTATITATTLDGDYTAECRVTVSASNKDNTSTDHSANIDSTQINNPAENLVPGKGTVLKGDTTSDTYKVTSADTSNPTVSYQGTTNSNQKSIKIPAAVTVNGVTYKVTSVADNAFKDNKKIEKVTIGSNIKTIGNSAFSGCSKLKTVTLGKNITTIGAKAFYKCTKLTKITIPSKVNKIGKQAFYGCKKLKNITIKTTKLTSKNVGSKAFKGISSKAVVKVPKSKLTAYKKWLNKKGVPSKAKLTK